MRFWVTVRAWAGSARPGRCKYCRRAIVWVIAESGRSLAFDLGFTVREVVTHPATGGRFLVLARDDRHACVAQREARRASKGPDRNAYTGRFR